MGSGLSCIIMKYEEKEVLTCFFEITNPTSISTASFQISSNDLTLIERNYGYVANNGASIIKAVTSEDKEEALICFVIGFQNGYCLNYEIKENKFSKNIKVFEMCKGSPIGMKVYYFEDKDEYMFICNKNPNGNSQGYKVVTFDDNDFDISIKGINSMTEANYNVGGKCYRTNSFSIIYLIGSRDYSIISDCQGDTINGKESFSTGKVELSYLLGENNFEYDDNGNEPELPILPSYTTIMKESIPISKIESSILVSIPKIASTSIQNKIHSSIFIESSLIKLKTIITTSIKKNIMSSILKSTLVNSQVEESLVIITSINKTKNEIFNDLDSLIRDKDLDKSYLITGEDYSIVIKPIDRQFEQSTVNIYFSQCEKILRQNNPSSTKFIILQVNMENKNEKCITDQVEYKVYNELGESIDLTPCKDVGIIIEYKIKDSSLLNTEKISSFKAMNVDVFNIKDTFFNDICYSYSDNKTNSDMILSDRVSDIYQNFSLCEQNCEYDSFNIDNMTVICNCKIELELSPELEEGNFQTSIESAFLNSNFGVIKCYNLVFGIKGKLNNIGFGYLD